jgi:hypothetical protein
LGPHGTAIERIGVCDVTCIVDVIVTGSPATAGEGDDAIVRVTVGAGAISTVTTALDTVAVVRPATLTVAENGAAYEFDPNWGAAKVVAYWQLPE